MRCPRPAEWENSMASALSSDPCFLRRLDTHLDILVTVLALGVGSVHMPVLAGTDEAAHREGVAEGGGKRWGGWQRGDEGTRTLLAQCCAGSLASVTIAASSVTITGPRLRVFRTSLAHTAADDGADDQDRAPDDKRPSDSPSLHSSSTPTPSPSCPGSRCRRRRPTSRPRAPRRTLPAQATHPTFSQ